MRKIIKNNMKLFVGLIIGVLVTGIVVYADTLLNAGEIDYTPSNSNFNVSKVDQALNTLYNMANGVDVSVRKFCELKSGTAEAIGSKYECDPGDGTKRNFYVLAVNNNNTLDLIMEHNITEGSSKTTMEWAEAMDYFNAGDGVSIKNNWTNIMKIDLPKAQDIANAVGNTSWKVGEKSDSALFCLGLKDHASCSNNGSWDKATDAGKEAVVPYVWLFNYTRECTAFGCTQSLSGDTNSNGKTEAEGYWTRDIVAQDTDAYNRAWDVARFGGLGSGTASDVTSYGVRPVITVYKANLY